MTLTLDVNGFTKDPTGTPGGVLGHRRDRPDGLRDHHNIPLDGGSVMIGDTIQLFIEVEAILQQPADA